MINILTIFDGRDSWLEPIFDSTANYSESVSCCNDNNEKRVNTYRLWEYSAKISHNLLDMSECIYIVQKSIAPYKNQVNPLNFNGEYFCFSAYVSTFGIGLLHNNINNDFNQIQHNLISLLLSQNDSRISSKAKNNEIDRYFKNQ